MDFTRKLLLSIGVSLILFGCSIWKQPEQSKNPSKESSPVSSAQGSTDRAIAQLDGKQDEKNRAVADRDSKLKSNVSAAKDANTSQPASVPTTVVDNELTIALSRLTDVQPDPVEAAEAARRKLLVETGKADEARASRDKAVVEATKLANIIGELTAQIDTLKVERDAARASEKQAVKQYQAQMEANRIEAERKMQRELDKQRNEFNRRMGYALIAGGIIFLFIGAMNGYAKMQTGDIPKAIVSSAFWAGSAAACFVSAWAINQWWFKWLVISIFIVGAAAIVIYIITEHKDATEKKTRLKEADEAESTLTTVMAVLESELKPDNPVFEKLGRKMNDGNKALLHELRAEQKRKAS